MKNLKKIGALLLALMMVLGMATVAMADVAIGSGDGAGTPPATTGISDNGTTATFWVKINAADNTPKTAFTYTVAPGDAVGNNIKPGVVGGVKFAVTAGTAIPQTVSTTTNTDDTVKIPFAANDAEKQEIVTLSLASSVFTSPGIYRYKITQSELTTEQTSIGLTADTYNVKALDLYVAFDNTTDPVTKTITNVVLSENEKTMTISESTATHATKVDGFTNKFGAEETDPENPTGPKIYDSYDITLGKDVTGNMASTSVQFPFDLTITYTENTLEDSDTTLNGLNVTVKKDTTKGGSATISGDTADVVYAIGSGTTLKLTMAATERIIITGVPKDAIVTLKETVEATDGYQISYTATDFASATNGTLAAKAGSGDSGKYVDDANGTVAKVNNADASLVYNNYMNAISPTGVVLRTAPYVLMLGATPLFVLLGKKRKEEEDEE